MLLCPVCTLQHSHARSPGSNSVLICVALLFCVLMIVHGCRLRLSAYATCMLLCLPICVYTYLISLCSYLCMLLLVLQSHLCIMHLPLCLCDVAYVLVMVLCRHFCADRMCLCSCPGVSAHVAEVCPDVDEASQHHQATLVQHQTPTHQQHMLIWRWSLGCTSVAWCWCLCCEASSISGQLSAT